MSKKEVEVFIKSLTKKPHYCDLTISFSLVCLRFNLCHLASTLSTRQVCSMNEANLCKVVKNAHLPFYILSPEAELHAGLTDIQMVCVCVMFSMAGTSACTSGTCEHAERSDADERHRFHTSAWLSASCTWPGGDESVRGFTHSLKFRGVNGFPGRYSLQRLHICGNLLSQRCPHITF